MTLAVEAAPRLRLALARPGGRALFLGGLAALLLLAAIAALAFGAARIPPARVLAILAGQADPAVTGDAAIVWQIRLPRMILGALVGAGLAVSGALMQGLFRNPLADPGLVGVSSGAGLAAAATIVLGHNLPLGGLDPMAILPLAAFLGGLAVTILLYRLSTRDGRTSVATMLLAGIAVGALAGALTGLLAYVSDDRQLRDLTFWSLGSLGGATWPKVAATAPAILPVLLAVPFLSRGLNALLLGEAEAHHLGIPVQRLKALLVVASALAVGASVAAAGAIGFIGIVVPHLVRLAAGPDHRLVLPGSALLGAAFLVGADILARTLVVPAELPIGIVTAATGAPFFLWLLLDRRTTLS